MRPDDPLIPESGVKRGPQSAFQLDFIGVFHVFSASTLTSLMVKSGWKCADRLETQKSPVTIRVSRTMVESAIFTNLFECCNCADSLLGI
jgi:hypothetical protein